MVNFANKLFLTAVLSFSLSGLSFAEEDYAGDPPAPPIRNLLNKSDVQKKVAAMETSCQSRFSKKVCACVMENLKPKLNGRDFDEKDLDMLHALVQKSNLKAFRKNPKFDITEDMMSDLESECVKNPKMRPEAED